MLRTRLLQGRLNKARRGELFMCVPIGYVRSAEGGIMLDPDEQVRAVVRLIFDKFAELGSVPKAHAYLVAHDIRIGTRLTRGPERGRLEWRRARRGTLHEMLRHPIYAGAYVWGRNPCDKTLKASGKSKSGRRTASPEEWLCLLKDRVPAYITWEQYEANRQRMRENNVSRGGSMVTGCPATLLNQLLVCGRCGKSMRTGHVRRSSSRRYVCDLANRDYGDPLCQGFLAAAVDRLIESLVLRTLEPAALELSLRAAERAEGERSQLHGHWRQKLERAGYEADRARRQYDAVDPENRLVARELERQWEQKLADLRQLEESYARFRQEQPQPLGAADREHIHALAADVPALWNAPSTSGADRRAVVRQLIEQVEATRQGSSERISVVVRWRGGLESRHEVRQGVQRYEQLAGYCDLKDRVLRLRGEGLTGDQIATALNQEGFQTPHKGPFTGCQVRKLLQHLGLAGLPAGMNDPAAGPGANEWWLPDLAAELGVRPGVIHRWRRRGWVHSRRLPGDNGRILVWADAGETGRLRRLRVHEVRRPRDPIPQGLRTPKERRPQPTPKRPQASSDRKTHERKEG